MRNIGTSLGITPQDISEDVDTGRIRSFPNQIKSMLITAMQQQGLYFSTSAESIGFDARRMSLLDKVISPSNNGQNTKNISFFDENFPNPAFSLVKDPMKVYAKFLTMWMNYKQIATLEYFDFAPLSSGRGLKYCTWKTMDQAAFEAAFSGKVTYLCRVRDITTDDLYRELDAASTPESDPINQNATDLLSRPEIFDLPIYNRYFILELGDADQPTAEQSSSPPAEDDQGEQGEQGEEEDDLEGIPEQEDVGLDEDRGECPPGQRINPYTGRCEPIGGFGI